VTAFVARVACYIHHDHTSYILCAYILIWQHSWVDQHACYLMHDETRITFRAKCDAEVQLACPALPCPALPCPDMCASNVGQVPEVWAARPDWGLHGHQQLCASGHSGRHAADLWQHLPRGWPRHEQSPVQEEPWDTKRSAPPYPPKSHKLPVRSRPQ